MSTITNVSHPGGVGELSLDRVARLNMLDGPTYSELTAALAAANTDRSVRSILLTGQGPHFCAGYDLGSSDDSAAEESVWTQWEKMEDGTGRLEAALRYSPKPIVCAVQGYCLGGGFELANSCDFIVAASDATFSLPEVRFSIVGPPRLLYFVPLRKAREILLLGDEFDAETAERIGLVNQVVVPESLHAEALRFARRLAALPPETVRHTRTLIQQTLDIQGIRAVESISGDFVLSKMTETTDRVRFRELREAEGMRAALSWIRDKSEGRVNVRTDDVAAGR